MNPATGETVATIDDEPVSTPIPAATRKRFHHEVKAGKIAVTPASPRRWRWLDA